MIPSLGRITSMAMLAKALHSLSRLKGIARCLHLHGKSLPQAHCGSAVPKSCRPLLAICIQRYNTLTLRFASNDTGETSHKPIGQLQPARMAISFTCKVCDYRQSKTFTKKAYEQGVVIIQCDGCKNRHLIADNLGWFDHIEARNVEEMLRQKGEQVTRYSSEGLLEVPAADDDVV